MNTRLKILILIVIIIAVVFGAIYLILFLSGKNYNNNTSNNGAPDNSLGLVQGDVINDTTLSNYREKYLTSPDGSFKAVTNSFEGGGSETYIENSLGNKIVSERAGSFIAWSPDSQKVLVYRSFEVTQTERQIYYLSINGEYYDSGLPGGVTGADISNDGSIVYTLTSTQSDDTKIYLRDLEGKDNLLVDGNNSILAWVRWSPEGDKIAYMQSDLAGRPGNQSIWIMDLDGSDQQMLSGVDWGHPPIWAEDGQSIEFINNGYLWKYVFN